MKGLSKKCSFGVRLGALLVLVCLGIGSVPAQGGSRVFLVKSKDIASYNLAIEGFRQKASEQWTVIEYDLKGTLRNTSGMISKMERERPDLVVAVGAKAMTALTESKVSYPVVFCMMMNPEKHDLQRLNTTGVSLIISPEEQIKVLVSLSPDIKKIGVLLRKQSSLDLLKDVTKLAKKYKVEIVPVELESEKDIPHKLRPVLDKIDALWMLDDSFIHSKESLQFVIMNTLENDLPFMAISKVFVKEGALVSLSPSFFRNGEQAAQLAEMVLNRGITPKNIPVNFHKEPDLIINLKIARKLKLTIPAAMLDKAEVYE